MVAVLAPHVGTLLLLESCFVPLWETHRTWEPPLEPAALLLLHSRATLTQR